MKKKKKKSKDKFNFRQFLCAAVFLIVAYFALRFPFFIDVNGQRHVTVEVGEVYLDQGAYHLFGWKITTEGTVDASTLGTYRIVYKSFLQRAVRTVKVVDTTPAELKLNGRERTYVSLNGTYEEAGITAIDNYDGDLSNQVSIEGEVDLTQCGEYQLTYTVMDSSQNSSTISRNVIVVNDDFDYVDSVENSDRLSNKMLKTIKTLVNDYAFALKYLQNTEDDSLIKNSSQCYLYQKLTNMVVQMHLDMPLDLSMQKISCALSVDDVLQDGDETEVYLTETDTVIYNYSSSYQSISQYLCIFRFNSRNELVDVYREEGAFYSLYQDYRDDNNYISSIDNAIDTYYRKWSANRQSALKALDDLNNGTITYKSAANKKATYSYNRDKAADYAVTYALKQNKNYFYISENNCVNFASQCLHAGGLPMVNNGSYVWKNYGYSVNNGSGASGFSYSWTATGYFMRFASNSNDVVFQTHLSPFLCEKGDVLMFGSDENDLSHATVCSGVVVDEQGKVIDILFCGNTNHACNASLMASSSLYTECEKVIGYN